MSKRLNLPSACSRYGAQMGRRNSLPTDPSVPVKLRLQCLQFVDYDYDQGGAYWGGGAGTQPVWCAWGEDDEIQIYVFFRAPTRAAWVRCTTNTCTKRPKE